MGILQLIILAVEVIIGILAYIILSSIHFRKGKIRDIEAIEEDKDVFTVFVENKGEELKKAGSPITVKTYLMILVVAPIVLYSVCIFLSGNNLIAILAAVFGLLIPDLIVRTLAARAEREFESNYARALEQLASSLRAGRNIRNAVGDVVTCKFLHPTMRDRFAGIAADLDMGVSIEEAFNRFANNTNNMDAKDVALAISIQAKTGGHEAEVVQGFSEDIRERIMMRKEIKTLFASTNIMIKFMNFLGPGITFFIALFVPDIISVYFKSTAGTVIFVFLVALMLIGILVNYRMTHKFKQK